MSTGALSPDRYKKVSKLSLTTPKTGQFNVYRDYWWAVTDDDCLLFYRPPGASQTYLGSPQANMNEAITRKVAESLQYPWPIHFEQIQVVYVPLNVGDYV